eukprot:IDg7995t1
MPVKKLLFFRLPKSLLHSSKNASRRQILTRQRTFAHHVKIVSSQRGSTDPHQSMRNSDVSGVVAVHRSRVSAVILVRCELNLAKSNAHLEWICSPSERVEQEPECPRVCKGDVRARRVNIQPRGGIGHRNNALEACKSFRAACTDVRAS